MTEPSGDSFGVVAGGGLLLVAGFVLFVHDDEAEVVEGGEEGGAGPEDDGGFAVSDAHPVGHALAGGKVAVHDSDLGAEPGAELGDHLGGEGDFRDEIEDLTTGLERFFGAAEVDLGFAGTGDAVKEKPLGFSIVDRLGDLVDRLFLVGIGGRGTEDFGFAFFDGFEESSRDEGFDGGIADLAEGFDFLGGEAGVLGALQAHEGDGLGRFFSTGAGEELLDSLVVGCQAEEAGEAILFAKGLKERDLADEAAFVEGAEGGLVAARDLFAFAFDDGFFLDDGEDFFHRGGEALGSGFVGPFPTGEEAFADSGWGGGAEADGEGGKGLPRDFLDEFDGL